MGRKQKHRKETLIQVGFNEADKAVIDRVVAKEMELRKDPTIGRATIIREHAMPSIQRRDEELREPALRDGDDRRSADERRAPALSESR